MNQRLYLALLLLLIGVGLGLRVQRFAVRVLWVDEIEQFSNIGAPFKNLLTGILRGMPGGFPGDYVLTGLARRLSDNRWVVTSPHILATVLGFYLFYVLCQKELRFPISRLTAFALLVFNRNLIFHALEIRPYAVLPTLALGVYLATRAILTRPAVSSGAQGLYGLFVWFTLCFHFFGSVMLSAVLPFQALILRPSESWKKTLMRVGVPLGIGSLIALPIVVYYLIPNIGMWCTACDPWLYCGTRAVSILSFVFGNISDLSVRFAWVLPTALVAAAFFIRDATWKKRLLWLILLVIYPIAFQFYSSLKTHYWMVPRQFVWVIPFWAVLVGMSLDAILSSRKGSSVKIPNLGFNNLNNP